MIAFAKEKAALALLLFLGCLMLLAEKVGWWRPAPEEPPAPPPRHLRAGDIEGFYVACVIDGRAIQNVVEVYEGAWLEAFVVDPESGKVYPSLFDDSGFSTARIYGDVQICDLEETLDLPPYVVTGRGEIAQLPLIEPRWEAKN